MRRIDLPTKTTSVTVYRDRALIERTATVTLEPGENTIVFTGLPFELMENSLKLKATGSMVMGNYFVETRHFTGEMDQRKAAINAKMKALSGKLQELSLKEDQYQGEKSFLEKMTSCVTSAPGEKGDACLDVTRWQKMMDFYRERYTAIDSDLLDVRKRVEKLNLEMAHLEAELGTLGSGETTRVKTVSLVVDSRDKCESVMSISYLVPGPSWKPLYNLRATTGENSLQLEYNGEVIQNTGEDWTDIELLLSTAAIGTPGEVPVLDPLFIDFYKPVPVPRARKRSRKMDDSGAEMLKAAAPSCEALPEELEVIQATVEKSGTGVSFVVPGKTTIPGYNRKTGVTLKRLEFSSSPVVRTVPLVNPVAYRTAEFTNTSDSPLLPGKANVFFDGGLVSTTALPMIMPEEKTMVSLGVDEGIKVQRRQLRRFRRNEGLLNKRECLQFEYEIVIENNSGETVTAHVQDRFPVSNHKDLAVKQVSPEIRENDEAVSMDGLSRITWKVILVPGAKETLPLAWQVEYPPEERVTGLELP